MENQRLKTEILKKAGAGETLIYRGARKRIRSDFSSESVQARREESEIQC